MNNREIPTPVIVDEASKKHGDLVAAYKLAHPELGADKPVVGETTAAELERRRGQDIDKEAGII